MSSHTRSGAESDIEINNGIVVGVSVLFTCNLKTMQAQATTLLSNLKKMCTELDKLRRQNNELLEDLDLVRQSKTEDRRGTTKEALHNRICELEMVSINILCYPRLKSPSDAQARQTQNTEA
jgi:hypothetical protein